MMQSEGSDPQENGPHTNDTNENASDDAQSSTTIPALVGMEQYVDSVEENQDTESIIENTQEEADEAAERELDKYIIEDPPQVSQNSLDNNEVTNSGEAGVNEVRNTNSEEEVVDEEDTDSEEEEEELMTGVAPSHEQEVKDEPLSPELKRKQRVDEILDGEINDFEDEPMTDADQELEQESASAPIPEGLCVECRDQVIRILFKSNCIFVYPKFTHIIFLNH
jgi:hypothetical protein